MSGNMEKVKIFRGSFLALVFVGLLFWQGNAFSAPLTASTPMTVVTVNNWILEASKSPSEVLDYSVTVDLWNVRYTLETLCWEWYDPRNFPTHPISGKNGRIWKIWSEDGHRHYNALGWDFLSAYQSCKNREGHPLPDYWVGTMISSLCDTNPSVCLARRRTNLYFVHPKNPNF